MTPKEKAIELYEKFKPFTLKVTYKMNDGSILENNWNAKQCALIAVDELIEATSMRYEFRNGEIVEAGRKPLQYWLDVKNEIENL